MSLVIPNPIEESVLQFLLQTQDLKLRLFSNDYEPAENSTVSSFTEVTGGGYAAITLDKDLWTIIQGNPSEGTYDAQTFSFTGTIGGTGNVYGYYVTDALGTALLWAENLPSAVNPFTPTGGSYVRILPRLQAS